MGITLECDPDLSKYDISAISQADDESLNSKPFNDSPEYKGKPGPKKVELSENEKTEIIQYISAGFGRFAGCTAANIGYPRFLRALTYDPEFRDRVFQAEMSTMGMLEARLYAAGMDGDLNAGGKYLSLKYSRQDARLQNKIRVQSFKLQKLAVESQLNAQNGPQRPSFACLSDQELVDYEDINKKIKSGVQPTSEEFGRLGFYTAKIIAHNNNPQNQPAKVDFVAQVAVDAMKLDGPASGAGSASEA